jgi:hypothetical protein
MKPKEYTYENIFGDTVTVSTKEQNPMLRAYGVGPTDKRCKECVFFIRKQLGGTYFKCQFRGNTNGAATDHRANWPTCKRFIERIAKLIT